MQSRLGDDSLDHLPHSRELDALKDSGIRIEYRGAEKGESKNEACHYRKCSYT